MAYQIPQQLEYREKIMFGLTFKQLVYALAFGLVCLLIFKKISNPIIKYTLMVLYSGLGMCFIFFDLESKIKNYKFYLKNRNLGLDNKKLKEFLGIKEIRENTIITYKNKKIAIIKVNPINFSIRLPDEKEAIMYAFQKFLNSLDFPTQILMSTESLDLDYYLSSLEKGSDKQLSKIIEGYKKFLESTIKDNKIMNRVFYLIFLEQDDIEIQSSICIDRFNALNLKARRLTNNELNGLIRKFFPMFKIHIEKSNEDNKQ